MIMKRLACGASAYYWNPPNRDLAAGFTLHREALGRNVATAISRAHELNNQLDAWRAGRGNTKELDLQPGFGTLAWLVERYYRSRDFELVSQRVRPDYRRELGLVCNVALKDGRRSGDLALASISAKFVDKLYEKLLVGKRGRRVRQANICISRAQYAWDVVSRVNPEVVPKQNPFDGLARETRHEPKLACTREHAFALSRALGAIGHLHLAVAPLICFEWLQRPENLLEGHLAWSHWRPVDRPTEVLIFHHKTGERIWHPVDDEHGPLYPELDSALATLERLGPPVVLTPGEKGAPRPYSYSYARALVRRARRLAGLPEHVTLDACRHGGMTELGDADLTEQGVMALSGHKTPDAARLYVKRTEAQRLIAARKRRAHVERKVAGSQNAEKRAESE